MHVIHITGTPLTSINRRILLIESHDQKSFDKNIFKRSTLRSTNRQVQEQLKATLEFT